MDIKNKNEVFSKAYSDSQGMIALADSKANISLTIHSLLITIGLGFSLLSDVFEKAGILLGISQGFAIMDRVFISRYFFKVSINRSAPND